MLVCVKCKKYIEERYHSHVTTYGICRECNEERGVTMIGQTIEEQAYRREQHFADLLVAGKVPIKEEDWWK